MGNAVDWGWGVNVMQGIVVEANKQQQIDSLPESNEDK